MRKINTSALFPTSTTESVQAAPAASENASYNQVMSNANATQNPMVYTMDANYEYWLYFRWRVPTKNDVPLPYKHLVPLLKLQVESVWWEDN
jgi:hypothetical protein